MMALAEGIPVLEHIRRNTVVDGDNSIIHFQVCGDGAKEGVGQRQLESSECHCNVSRLL